VSKRLRDLQPAEPGLYRFRLAAARPGAPGADIPIPDFSNDLVMNEGLRGPGGWRKMDGHAQVFTETPEKVTFLRFGASKSLAGAKLRVPGADGIMKEPFDWRFLVMINVTPSAASKITELLTEENKVDAGLRVFVQGGGCSGFQYGLMIDEGEGDATTDAVIESNGVKLLVDPISARYLRGAEVDFVDNVTGGGFTIKNPNAKSTCGCGSSFSV
jgi:iron-sulfur cluster insertion protein